MAGNSQGSRGLYVALIPWDRTPGQEALDLEELAWVSCVTPGWVRTDRDKSRTLWN